MYNFIRKDVVASAIKWLKEKNQLYGDIEINDEWADDWINSDLSTLMNECGKMLLVLMIRQIFPLLHPKVLQRSIWR